MIIGRPAEAKRLRETKKWTLVYGRRKTGKSFLCEHYLDFSDYFFVKRDRTIISKRDAATLSYETFLALLKRGMADGKLVVVDEFHRLGEGFSDELHAMTATERKGRLVLVSSTLHLSKNIIGKNSPLLGFVSEMPIWPISLSDCLAATKKMGLGKKERLELAIMLREPLAVEYADGAGTAEEKIASVLEGSSRTMPALVGEIFSEEERTSSAIYDGIIRAVAGGHVVSTEIADYLHSRRLIKNNDASMLQQYLSNLMAFGILRRVMVLGKGKFIYKHASSLVRLYYYADEKYNFSERRMSGGELSRIITALLPHMVEDEVRNFLSEKLSLSEAVAEGADFEVDGCLMRFKKVQVALEVKWKKEISASDIQKAEKNLSHIPANEKWLFVPDKSQVLHKTSLKIVDIEDFE